MERVLVTGSSGFVGQTLVPMLLEEGFEVWGADRSSGGETFPGKKFLEFDLSDTEDIDSLLAEAAPDFIVHLAALSSAGRSFEEPSKTIEANMLPALRLLEVLRKKGMKCRLLAIGSADEYGPVNGADLPISEDVDPNPVNPYALSKLLQEKCCLLYAALYHVDVVLTRSFNHTGPGQTDTFVLPSFARQVVEIKRGWREPVISTGDSEVCRDFLDVRDAAAAYMALLRRGASGRIYNVCSGRSYKLKDLLNRLCKIAGVNPAIKTAAGKLRPSETRQLVGSNSRIQQDTGWCPRFDIDKTLRSLVEFWEKELKKMDNKTSNKLVGGNDE